MKYRIHNVIAIAVSIFSFGCNGAGNGRSPSSTKEALVHRVSECPSWNGMFAAVDGPDQFRIIKIVKHGDAITFQDGPDGKGWVWTVDGDSHSVQVNGGTLSYVGRCQNSSVNVRITGNGHVADWIYTTIQKGFRVQLIDNGILKSEQDYMAAPCTDTQMNIASRNYIIQEAKADGATSYKGGVGTVDEPHTKFLYSYVMATGQTYVGYVEIDRTTCSVSDFGGGTAVDLPLQ